MAKAATPKDTIYVDIDDEITAVIDKVQNSSGKLIALVLPKRASVFQSIVNMKLLKRAADSANKNVVLITAEAGLLPLAGAAGVHVAKTLSSKPEIPLGPDAIVDSNEAVNEDAPIITGNEPEDIDPATPVGELAAAKAVSTKTKDGMETVTLNNDEPLEDAALGAAAAGAADKTAKPKKNKKLKVPNFNKFRLILGIIVLLLIILIVGFFILNSSLAKATINISTNATNVPVSLSLDLSTSADKVTASSGTLPAKYVSQQKTFTQQVTTTGQKNEGTKASGSITISGGSCSPTPPSDIPAGTGASANGQTYIIEDNVSFTPVIVNHNQCEYQGTDSTNSSNGSSIPIVAQSGGSGYNVSGVSFTIVGNSNYSASGSASGGTDNIVQTVNQNDIDNAKDKISTGSTASLKSGLDSQLKGDGYYPLDATFTPGTPAVTSSAQVGETANSVTVTEVITYSMFGVYKSDLTKLVGNNVDNQINTKKQSILDYGLGNANYSINSQSSTNAQLTMSTTAIAGPELNIASVKQEAAGKKAGDIKTALMVDPNVTNVKVSFSPFWVGSAPSNPSKITVKIAKPSN